MKQINDKMLSVFYEKQILLNRIGLPYDIVREIKNFCFLDNVSGESKKIKEKTIQILKTAVSREAQDDITYSFPDIVYNIGGRRKVVHWAYGFINNNEILQLQAVNCVQCGNYHMFNLMRLYPHSPAIFCHCRQDDIQEITDNEFTDNEMTDNDDE